MPPLIATLSSEHFPFPSLINTPILEQQQEDRITYNYAKPMELQRLKVSTYHHVPPT